MRNAELLRCKENTADTGTRPEMLKPEHLLPGSNWLSGMPWMREPLDQAINSGVIKSIEDIKLDNEQKKLAKEEIIMESSLNVVSKQDKLIISNKVVERETFSDYIYPPLKYSSPKYVRIMGYVVLAARKFKSKMILARLERG